jgi:hypothetical protein
MSLGLLDLSISDKNIMDPVSKNTGKKDVLTISSTFLRSLNMGNAVLLCCPLSRRSSLLARCSSRISANVICDRYCRKSR